MVPGSNQDCYVVFKGRHPGIYPTCEVAEPEVTEFSHNLHRRYPTYEAGWYEAGWKAWFEFSGGQVNGGSLSGGELQLVSVAEDVPISGYAPLPTETGFHVRDDSYYRRVFEPTWGPFTKYENFWKQVGVKTQHSVATQSPVEGTTSQDADVIPLLQEAVASLEGRVSQFEAEKLDLFIQLSRIIEQLSILFNLKECQK